MAQITVVAFYMSMDGETDSWSEAALPPSHDITCNNPRAYMSHLKPKGAEKDPKNVRLEGGGGGVAWQALTEEVTPAMRSFHLPEERAMERQVSPPGMAGQILPGRVTVWMAGWICVSRRRKFRREVAISRKVREKFISVEPKHFPKSNVLHSTLALK